MSADNGVEIKLVGGTAGYGAFVKVDHQGRIVESPPKAKKPRPPINPAAINPYTRLPEDTFHVSTVRRDPEE